LINGVKKAGKEREGMAVNVGGKIIITAAGTLF
jgi:hypothetical protein